LYTKFVEAISKSIHSVRNNIWILPNVFKYHAMPPTISAAQGQPLIALVPLHPTQQKKLKKKERTKRGGADKRGTESVWQIKINKETNGARV